MLWSWVVLALFALVLVGSFGYLTAQTYPFSSVPQDTSLSGIAPGTSVRLDAVLDYPPGTLVIPVVEVPSSDGFGGTDVWNIPAELNVTVNGMAVVIDRGPSVQQFGSAPSGGFYGQQHIGIVGVVEFQGAVPEVQGNGFAPSVNGFSAEPYLLGLGLSVPLEGASLVLTFRSYRIDRARATEGARDPSSPATSRSPAP